MKSSPNQNTITVFNKHSNQPPAVYYQQPQYPAYYPPPGQAHTPVPFGNMDTRAPPPYQYPPQPSMPPQQQAAARPWFRITKEEVRNLANDQPIVAITRQSAFNIPKELSSKSSVALTRPDGSLMGTIRFHSMTSTDIDITINGHASKLSDSMMMGDKFTFKPISRGAVTTFGGSGEKWCWKLKGHANAMLYSAKSGGELLAKVEGGMLVFEKPGMSHAELDEILVTAVAMHFKGSRNKKDEETAEAVFEAVGGIAG
ncbi:hypothetical protein PRZ48_003939 [Zasmidium cellare]|uniref:Altered inheritance of mitochondria protein 24, mitochondrial n=1 Tax=Zasmidium cellare TaxID=395010 RepID=A0ABR0EWG1_ZASCE|nr:hypothetical protein PRZ48_003939 [Zasmidium cellare]